MAEPPAPAPRDTAATPDLGGLRRRLRGIIAEKGHTRLAEPVQLASGQLSRDFIDAKAALAAGRDLALACEAILALVADSGVGFDAVGGLTMGADQFAHGVALLGDRDWFVVRKQPKGRGTDRVVEGAAVGPGTRVLLVDDIVTTGGSIRRAYEVVRDLGGDVVFATTVVDRGEAAAPFFADVGVPYEPLLTYRDLGIDPVGP